MLPIQITTHDTIASIDETTWDALVDSPFLEHRFLQLLEDTGCVGEESGWIPAYVTATQSDQVIGALPLFVKTHSAGEFVFDWGWADAAHRVGINYYPKAVVAAPLTPVTGSRLLVDPLREDVDAIRTVLIQAGLEVVKALGLSSIHYNFISDVERPAFEGVGLPIRIGTQYHWYNERSSDGEPFETFDQFLAEFRSKRRANVRRERRKLLESGVTTRVLTGDEITGDHLRKMFRYYKATIDKFHWGRQYLNAEFFERAADRFGDRLHFVFAYQDDESFAGTFNLVRDDRLYGRYWGCTKEIEFTHFELCMYTPIRWCIENQIAVFEPGAGGEHKFERGFRPTFTHSAHYVEHPGLFDAVRMAIRDESRAVKSYRERLRETSPLKEPGF
jgi:predicted N-acyltransferase